MDELKNKTYLEFVAEKELAEEANRPAEDKKELSKGERFVKSLVHFWSYKKWYVIIPLIVLIILSSLVYTYVVNHKKSFFKIALVNIQLQDSSILPSENDEFMSRLVNEGKATAKDEFIIQDKYRHQMASDPELSADQDIAGSTQRLSVEVMNDLVDIMLVNSRCCDDYADSKGLSSLDTIFSSDELKLIGEDNLYYHEINGTSVPVGIKADAFDEFDSLVYREGDTYVLVISDFTSRKDIAHDYVMFMLED
ncbi:MAG: hypothetical protein MJ166_03165 [Clostridia bacterium]|nr:hypothetical protein [Clostridia bacterium]